MYMIPVTAIRSTTPFSNSTRHNIFYNHSRDIRERNNIHEQNKGTIFMNKTILSISKERKSSRKDEQMTTQIISVCMVSPRNSYQKQAFIWKHCKCALHLTAIFKNNRPNTIKLEAANSKEALFFNSN